MARTVVGEAVVVREKYYWPDAQLNIWTIIMLATAGTILGVFAEFLMINNRMELGDGPWYVPPLLCPMLVHHQPLEPSSFDHASNTSLCVGSSPTA